MEKVIAKFQCWGTEKKEEYQQTSVKLSAVTNGCEENKSFSKYTPAGNINMSISFETPAADFFEQGEEYYVVFEKVKK